jgi:hypothetical protein
MKREQKEKPAPSQTRQHTAKTATKKPVITPKPVVSSNGKPLGNLASKLTLG